jgi:hypothetical protein
MAWLREADELWIDADQLDAAFGSWIAVMTAQLFHAPGPSQPFDRPVVSFASNWNTLAGHISGLGQTPLAQAWLDAVGLLCTPEMGMTSSADIPPLLPPGRARHIKTLRTDRARRLPPHLRELAGILPRTATQQAAAEKAGTARPRARAPRPANRGEP